MSDLVLPPYQDKIDPTSFLSTREYNPTLYSEAWTDQPGTVLSCSGKLIGGRKRPIQVRKSKNVHKTGSSTSKKIKFKKRTTRKKDDINFAKLEWGSFTRQFKAYTRAGGSAKDLRAFSKIVLKPTENFAEKTKQRARFYLNVIDKK
jgi:hypothetical protein